MTFNKMEGPSRLPEMGDYKAKSTGGINAKLDTEARAGIISSQCGARFLLKAHALSVPVVFLDSIIPLTILFYKHDSGVKEIVISECDHQYHTIEFLNNYLEVRLLKEIKFLLNPET
ncbi:MAG: hypothetical protein KAX13_09520, partial [Candidatus Krumholzibacteria bacterium]|nr:hypothetical protein [Candidatus Krumholzibacteria bacterium]